MIQPRSACSPTSSTKVLSEEAASKTAKHVTMGTQLARFPFVKSLDSFDFSYQPSIDRKPESREEPRSIVD
jgi:hypothetical protein